MKIKKLMAAMLPLSLGFSPISFTSLASCSDSVKFNSKDVKLYLLSPTKYENQRLYFSDSLKGIPFIDLNDATSFIQILFDNNDPKASIKSETSGSEFKLIRENGAYVTFNFDANTIYSNDINLFKSSASATSGLDIYGYDGSFYDEQGKKIEGLVKFAQRNGDPVKTKSEPLFIDLNVYNIPMYRQKSKYLVPFTTFYNVACYSTLACLFNGENLFMAQQSLGAQEYQDLYYSFEKQNRSKELAEYNYNEFCRDLDYVYGLQEEHNISSFDKFFVNNGIKDLLMSDDRYKEDVGYSLLQYTYLADSHTGFGIQNAYGGYDPTEPNKITSEIPLDTAFLQNYVKTLIRNGNRKTYGVTDETGSVNNAVLKTNDSLVLTFDKFRNQAPDYYYSDQFKTEEQKQALAQTGDTVAIVSYANDLIKKDIATGNPSIKNVVIDLSANTGGMASSAIFLLGWLDSAVAQVIDPINNCKGSTTYKVDVNFDKVVDKNDKLVSQTGASYGYTGKVYCLTSCTSFSCGNYVPAMLKQTETVKMVGTTSGGGACLVHVTGTADGSGLCFSSNQKLCRIVNGSYYSIDEGVEPDYYLADQEIMYGGNQEAGQPTNRKKLIEYLNNLV